MINGLISGVLIQKPELKTAKSGNQYCRFTLNCPTNEDRVMVSVIAFSEQAEKVSRLDKNDALVASGLMKIDSWTDKATGESRHGFNLTAGLIMTDYERRKKIGKSS